MCPIIAAHRSRFDRITKKTILFCVLYAETALIRGGIKYSRATGVATAFGRWSLFHPLVDATGDVAPVAGRSIHGAQQAMTLNSSSTDVEVAAQYMDNLTYDSETTSDSAIAFIAACRAMMIRGIIEMGTGEQRMRFSTESLQKQIEDAEAFIATLSGATGSVVHHSLEFFRD